MRRLALLLIGCIISAGASSAEKLKPTDTISLMAPMPAASTTTTDFQCDSGASGSATHTFEKTPDGFASRIASVRIGASDLAGQQMAEANSAIGSALITQVGAECAGSRLTVTVTTWSREGGLSDVVRISSVAGALEVM